MPNRLVQDPVTGFLQPSGHQKPFTQRQLFDANRKLKFLELATKFITERNSWPPIASICQTVGINQRTFEIHKKNDPVFKDAWEEVVSHLKHVYTSKLADKADSKNGIVANIAILRYLETGSFVDQMRVNSLPSSSISKRINDALIVDADAEIVENTGNEPITSTPDVDSKVVDSDID